MRNHILKPTLPTDKRTSPRSQILTTASSKRSPRVPSIPTSPSALDDKVTDNNDPLILSPLQSNRRGGRSARAPPAIVRPRFETNSPLSTRNQKKPKEKASARSPRCESILDIKTHPKCQKYVSDIERIEKLKNKLTTRHAENESYYRNHYNSFLRILMEAINENPAKIPIVVQNTKMFFEGLLQNLIGKRGKLDKANFDFEGTLRSIITSPSSTINDKNEDENVFQELFDNKSSGRRNNKDNNEPIDLSKLKQYEAEIEVIKGLMQKLVDRHPENERYYRKHYESFLRILSEAVSSNSQKAPTVIRNTKMFFEGLLNGLIGRNGRLKTKSFDFEEKLRKVISNENNNNDDDDNDDDNIIQELIDEDAKLVNNQDEDDDDDDDENDQTNMMKFMSDVKEINNIVQQLIDKHPENEDYYRDRYDSFMNVLNEAIKTNSKKAPVIIKNAKTFFEGLLNDQIGENGKIEDSEFNFEERLRNILTQDDDDDNNNDNNENVFEDLFNKDDKAKLQQYESEIKEIQDLMQQLIDKHPENEDYYRNLYDSFMKILNEAIKTNDEKAPVIIKNAKTFFEGLLNDQIGENGKIEDSEFNFEERLRNILTQDNEEEDNDDNVFEDLFNKKEQAKLQQYESEIKEINNLVQQLIDKHPENEDYYRNLYDSFMKILNEAIKTNDEKAPVIIKNAKTFFEGLLNDQIGENGKIEDSEFNFEERLRNILTQDNEEEEGNDDNVFEDLFDKKEQAKLQQYESEIKEIEDLMQQLIDKHPENEDYYRNLYDSFLKVLKEAVDTDSEKAPVIIKNTKTFFEGLLNDQIGENGKIEDSEFNFEERLRNILTQDNEEEEGNDDNVFKDLFDKKEQEKLQQYESEIKEIDNLVQQLIDKHPENEDYYRNLYDSFMKILNEAIKTNDEKAPVIIKNAKTFFEGLLNDQIGENGKVEDSEFNFEERLRNILTQNSEEEEGNDDNVFKDLFDKKEQEKLQQYESEIKEIDNLVQQLIDKHPENEDYYRNLYDSFMKILNEAIKTNDEKAPTIIQNAKTFFEGLLNDQIGENGKIEDSEFNFEERLRNILTQDNEEEDNSNDNVFEDLFNKKEQEKLQQYESEIKEIDNLVQQLIDKHPENEDYYRNLYDSFMKILNEAIKTNDEKAPVIIKNAKTFFEGLLNDQIGENGKIEDSEFNFEERLRNILTQDNEEEDNSNDNVFEDLLNKKGKTDLQQYESEIKEIEDLMHQLIEKNPENEDYYRMRYDAFMRVLDITVKENSENAPTVIKETKELFQKLLKDEMEKSSKFKDEESLSKTGKSEKEGLDESDFNFTSSGLYNIPALAEDPEYDDDEESKNKSKSKSQSILQTIDENGSTEDDDQGGTKADQNKDDEQSILDKYESEIGEIQNIMEDLIKKHPENEDYYKKLYEAFMKVIKEAEETNSSAAPEIIKATKSIFEDLLNSEQDQLDFDLEDKLREILSKSNENQNENENENDESEQSVLNKYKSEIGEIKNLMNELIEQHPENEDYYRKLYEAFMKVIKEAEETNSSAAPEIIKATKSLFEDLLNSEQDQLDFDLEDKLREILSKSNENQNENEESVLDKYESEIGEIQNIMEDLIKKHPENEDYYRKLYEAFMKVIKEAEETNSSAAPEIIKATKSIFEDLLNSEQDQLDFDLEDKLRDILSKSNENEDEQSVTYNNESEMAEIKVLLHKLIEKYPENEDYYQKLYDSFIVIVRQATEANSQQVPGIIHVTKLFFEELLNGKHATLDFDIGEKLNEILSSVNKDENNDKNDSQRIEKDENSEENEQTNLDKYESEIGEIQNIMEDLIKKHPENEDYYKKLFEAFMGVIKEAAKTDNPASPEIIEATKTIFEDLLNSEQDQLDFDLEDKLRDILSKSNENQNENENNENENENEDEQSNDNKNRSEMDEIEELLHKLIDKHPENEDFYQKLYDSFIGIIKQASEANSPQVPGIIRATKLFFEELLNGEHAKIEFNIGEKLREILLSVNNIQPNSSNENENENEDEQADSTNNNNDNDNDNENDGDDDDENENQSNLSDYKSEIGEIKNLMQDLIDKHPENEDYYRKLYEAFMKVVKEAAEANNPAAQEIIKATKTIFEDLYNGEQDQLDYDLEDKLREILSTTDSIYKPYNEIEDENENDDDGDGRKRSQSPKFEKLYPPPQVTPNSKKRTSTVPNYQTIICALRFSCLPGPRFTKLVDTISTTMKQNKDERFVLLFASRTQKFKGIYILSDDELSAKKMWGEGPNLIKSEDCGAFSKYITNQKIFEPLQVKAFTQTTDAFSLKKKAEPDLW